MLLPKPYLKAILNQEPGQAYRACLDLLGADNSPDRPSTQEIVYGCEIQFALQALTEGKLDRLYNFGDLDGRGSRLMWSVLDPRPSSRVCFLGAGPFPVTALLLRQRYPQARVTCLENDLTGFLIGREVCRVLQCEVDFLYQDAHQADLSEFEVIVMAAMVGDRHTLVEKLLRETRAELVVRGSLSFTDPRVHTVASDFDETGQVSSKKS